MESGTKTKRLNLSPSKVKAALFILLIFQATLACSQKKPTQVSSTPNSSSAPEASDPSARKSNPSQPNNSKAIQDTSPFAEIRSGLFAFFDGKSQLSLKLSVANEMETLGAILFFDKNLSSPSGQSCSSCHAPNASFTDPEHNLPTSKGAVFGRFGARNAPTVMYAKFSPPLAKAANSEGELEWTGGQFWDGRAATLEDQAKGPFLNSLEMNNANLQEVVAKVRTAKYAERFKAVFGGDSLLEGKEEQAFDQIAKAIASFERRSIFSPFSSKYDAYLKGQVTLTEQEKRGLEVFENPKKGNCMNCHGSQPSADGQPPLFTDFTFDNLGVPRNPANPVYLKDGKFDFSFVDVGLQATTKDAADLGKFKVPTLRNITETAPYMHNGYFPTLRSVIEFYNSRDTKPKCASKFTSFSETKMLGCLPVPEVIETVNSEELGNLKLSEQDMQDLEVFLGTLTDGWQAPRN